MKKRLKALSMKSKVALATAGGSLIAYPVYAEEPASLALNFDITQMFTWAQAILDAMMPVVYISMGVGLGFLIVRALKAAFN